MNINIFFFLLLKYFEKTNYLNFIPLKSYNLKFNYYLKNKIFFLFLNFKLKIEKKLQIFSILQNNISTYDFINLNSSLKQQSLNLNWDYSFISYNNKILTKHITDSLFNNYYNFYSMFFNFFILKNINQLKNYFFFQLKEKKNSFSFLNFYLLKKNFLKSFYLMINLLNLNYSPFIITDDKFDKIKNQFDLYLKFNQKHLRYGFNFCTASYIKLKKIKDAKQRKIPLISIVDINTNLTFIDYPIFINTSTKTNSFFFFCFIINIFFSLLIFKRKKYTNLFLLYKNLNYLKEFILKNEYNL